MAYTIEAISLHEEMHLYFNKPPISPISLHMISTLILTYHLKTLSNFTRVSCVNLNLPASRLPFTIAQYETRRHRTDRSPAFGNQIAYHIRYSIDVNEANLGESEDNAISVQSSTAYTRTKLDVTQPQGWYL